MNSNLSIKLAVFIAIVLYGCFATAFSENTGEAASIASVKKENEVLAKLQKDLKVLSFVDLAFSLDELVPVLEKDSSLRKTWQDKIIDFFKIYPGKNAYKIVDREISFFYSMVSERKDLMQSCPKTIAFLQENRVDTVDRKFLKKEQYAEFIEKYNEPKTNLEEVSRQYFNLLLIEGNEFVGRIEKNEKAIKAFRKWIGDIEKNEFSVAYPYTIPSVLVERKKGYIINKYEKSQTDLLLEALKTIKEAQVHEVD
ncbi:MAG: hypothetical protein A2293_05385 [Elusimicrobia bacterium RIFOXYB2_FULL_49_7]|nr:MAG: hypothetical protein A2293_05385 [Elusimicrobia bacterium RIFOXYB2_FULL_49_7]